MAFLKSAGKKQKLKSEWWAFCALERHCEYRLATNLPAEGESAVSHKEIAEIYRQRWQIE